MRGEIVRTCKTLRVRSRLLRVQTGLYRSLYPVAATFLFPFKKTHGAVCEYVLEYIRRAGRFRTALPRNDGLEFSNDFVVSKDPLVCVESPSALCQKPHPRDEGWGGFARLEVLDC